MKKLFALSIIISVVFSHTNLLANPTGDIIDNLFGDNSAEFLEPDQAFNMSVQAVTANEVVIHWVVAEGYYLYADKFKFSLADKNIPLADVAMPMGKMKNDPDFGNVEVYRHSVSAQLPLDGIVLPANLTLRYQGCKEDVLCYPPITKTIPLLLNAANASEATMIETSLPMASSLPPISEQNAITKNLINASVWRNALVFFGFGILLALTPCVLPMLPILSALIIGRGKSITTIRALTMSLSYVIAMALTYALLGVIAGSLHLNLQAASQNIWLLSAFSGIFVLLALSMLDFYTLQLPLSWQNKLLKSGGRGGSLMGAAGMGVLSAIIVGPCIAPPLAGALLYISQTGDAVLGGLALFAMGIGMGVPLLIIGTSLGKILPKTGAWMKTVKHFFGVIMLGVAIWFLGRVLSESTTLLLWSLLFLITAVYLGALDRTERTQSWQGFSRGLGAAMLIYGIILMVGAASGGGDLLHPLKNISLTHQSEQKSGQALSFRDIAAGDDDLMTALMQAGNEERHTMLYFSADWCVICQEIEQYTFSDPQVQDRLRDTLLLKADVTHNGAKEKKLLRKFNLFGPPAILFFAPDGSEYTDYRIVGFKNAEDFLRHISPIIPTK